MKKDTPPQKAMMREFMQSYLKENDLKIKDGTDVNSIMCDMMSVVLKGALDEDLEQELGYSKYDYRNKDTNNSRNGEFEPRIVKKFQNTITQDMEEKIISMYAKGMTASDIENHMKELYDIDISDSTIRQNPFNRKGMAEKAIGIRLCSCLHGCHPLSVRSEGRIIKKAVYIALGIDMNGHKMHLACT